MEYFGCVMDTTSNHACNAVTQDSDVPTGLLVDPNGPQLWKIRGGGFLGQALPFFLSDSRQEFRSINERKCIGLKYNVFPGKEPLHQV